MAELYSVGDRFRSNDGKGPMIARLAHIEGEKAFLAFRNDRGKKESGAWLTFQFLSSNNCGWRLIEKAGEPIYSPPAMDLIAERITKSLYPDEHHYLERHRPNRNRKKSYDVTFTRNQFKDEVLGALREPPETAPGSTEAKGSSDGRN